MELTQLEYFLTVARYQHMTRAAKALSITQPALSQAISKLENELGVPLFERKGRNVQLSRYGSMFSENVERAMRELEHGKKTLEEWSNPETGLISIAFLNILGADLVPKLVRDYQNIYPKIKFELEQGNHELIDDALNHGKFDLIITSMKPKSEEYSWITLEKAPLYIIVSNNHRLANTSNLSIHELKNENYIGLKSSCGLKVLLDACIIRSEAELIQVYEAEDLTTVAGFVAAGLGVSLVPRTAGLLLEGLTWIPIQEKHWNWEVGLQWRTDQNLSPAVKKFIDYVKRTSEKSNESLVELS
ncbi:LysR family transcriptional regulator [Paenibacillus radicis (ex Gao et al. 2016)]|uniref:HTH-type transcriptional regulator YybE n=1 Tax=Paenibacillus radicis (ex Gao et al. 2016) TaxID=1737354 RepID=A0A917LUK1_9BACL|nr:LysR family transcriptional regulator [Paenibacillus radicis (ex Gao et al. 2016)]GGG57831.1 putative HTH-type transcriptional regulator YybE [Paenibacillus radicis (ex Gao et al. 2016)]